jgi:thiamine biosynthesis lipoprotein
MSSSAALALLLSAATLQPYEAVQPHMGTLFSIKLYAASEQQAKEAFRAAFARIAQLDATLSDYKTDSELSRITALAIRTPRPISNDLFEVLAKGQLLAEQTGGAFDVTVGPLTHLWRQSRRARSLPKPEILTDALAHSGYRKMHLNGSSHTVSFDVAGMQLDVGGIAKGFAADEALKVISGLGIKSALVAASGDLAFSEAPSVEKGWKVAIDALPQALLLTNGAISTSGAAEQNFEVNGVRYSHILDPQTGLGLTSNITTTVIAPRGLDADGLATAINVLGIDRGLAFIEDQAGCAAIVSQGGQVRESTSFRALSRERARRGLF